MIACGFDVHRAQITFDLVDHETGELRRGRVAPATREELRRWLAEGDVARLVVAVEGTTGWRFVAEEVEAAGGRVVLAEPGETRALRGPKRRAKTDRADARWLRELLERGELPVSWIPPGTCSSCAVGCSCARRSRRSGVAGCNGSTRSCSITGSRSAGSSRSPPRATGSRRSSCRLPAGRSSRQRSRRSTSSARNWTQSISSFVATHARILPPRRSAACTAWVT